MNELVIARYNENLDWISQVPNNYKVTIYNKGTNIDLPHIILENVGRESMSYCHHIITNWDKLSEYTTFCQGNPFEHSKEFISQLSSGNKVHADFIGISDERGCPYHCGLDIVRYEKHFNPDKQYPLHFGAGAQFTISCEIIRSKGLQFWKDVYLNHWSDKDFPWIIERYWMKILNL